MPSTQPPRSSRPMSPTHSASRRGSDAHVAQAARDLLSKAQAACTCTLRAAPDPADADPADAALHAHIFSSCTAYSPHHSMGQNFENEKFVARRVMLSPSARALEDDVSASVAEVQHRVKSIRHKSVCMHPRAHTHAAIPLPNAHLQLCMPLPLIPIPVSIRDRRLSGGGSERPCLEIETLEGLALSPTGIARHLRPAGPRTALAAPQPTANADNIIHVRHLAPPACNPQFLLTGGFTNPTRKLLNLNAVSTKGYCITSTGSCSAGGSSGDGRTTYESLHSLLAAVSPGSGFV